MRSSTIAQDYDKFWVGETSEIVKVVERDQVLPNGISTTRRPIQATTPNFVPQQTGSKRTGDIIYDGCGDTKTCFGSPDNCVASKSCQTFSAVIVKGEFSSGRDRFLNHFEISRQPLYHRVAISAISWIRRSWLIRRRSNGKRLGGRVLE